MRLLKGCSGRVVAYFALLLLFDELYVHAFADTREVLSISEMISKIREIRVRCESYELWTPGLQAEQKTIDDRLLDCLSRFDALNRALPLTQQPTVSQKSDILLELDNFLRLIRYFSNNLRNDVSEAAKSSVGLSLSQMNALEQSTRLAISLVNSFETWEGKMHLSLGIHQRAGHLRYLSGATASLKLDLGQNIEGFSEIQTATPRLEESSTVELPPNSLDLISVSQMWVKFKKSKRLHFMFGLLPDSDDELAPERWPFFTLGTFVNVFSGYDWSAFLLFRHDTYGVWDYSLNSYKPSRIERNFTSLEWSYSPYLSAKDELELNARFQLHWYSDPEGTLTRLGIGRYDDLQPSRFDNISYRVAKIDQNTKVQFNKAFLFENFSTVFWNLDHQKFRGGRYVSLGASYKATAWMVGPKVYAASIECLSIPPVGLNDQLFPNTKLQGASLNFTKNLWEKTSLSVQVLAQRNSIKSLQESCPFAAQESLKPHSITEKYVFSIEHVFSPETSLGR